MSSYFDQKAEELRAFRVAGTHIGHDDVRRWTQSLRTDLAIACEFDREGPLAFPAGLRDDVYRLFLRHDAEAWPCGIAGFGVDDESDAQGLEHLARLVESLHDLFHAAAQMGWPGRDNPQSATQAMDARMELRCEALIAQDPTLTLPPLPPLEPT